MKILLTSFLFFLSCSIAWADDFACLRVLQGGTVRWDMDWQKDRTDHDVVYKIVQVSEVPLRKHENEMILELVAEGPAKNIHRTSKIHLEHAADLFCSRATRAVAPSVRMVREVSLKLQTAAAELKAKAPPFSPSELPFRVYENGRWRPHRPVEGALLRVCVTKEGLYACTDTDFQVYSRNAVAKLDGRTHHEFPFIRFHDGGWVRGSEADLPRVGEVSVCSAMGRKFSCLTEEKNAFSEQLARVSERTFY